MLLLLIKFIILALIIYLICNSFFQENSVVITYNVTGDSGNVRRTGGKMNLKNFEGTTVTKPIVTLKPLTKKITVPKPVTKKITVKRKGGFLRFWKRFQRKKPRGRIIFGRKRTTRNRRRRNRSRRSRRSRRRRR